MKINVLCDLFVFQNFIHSGAGNTELSGYIRCASPLAVERQHTVSADGAPATKADTFQFCFQSTFIRAFQYSLSLGLGYSRQNGDHHKRTRQHTTNMLQKSTNSLCRKFRRFRRRTPY